MQTFRPALKCVALMQAAEFILKRQKFTTAKGKWLKKKIELQQKEEAECGKGMLIKGSVDREEDSVQYYVNADVIYKLDINIKSKSVDVF